VKQGRSVLLIGCLAFVAGCGGKAKEEKPVAQKRGATEGRFLVCIIDVSASMKQNDRSRYAEQGAKLAVALLDSTTNFGAVAFSSGAWVQADMQAVGTKEGRKALQAQLSGIPRQGSTNFVGALAVSRRLIMARMAAESNGAVIFLTDGKPTVGGKMDDVKAEVDFYTAMKWPIYTIGLSDKADTEVLQKMAAETGGAHFSVLKSEDLLSAFVDVVSLSEGYFVKRGQFDAVTIMPDTKKLVYLVAKGSPEAGIGDVSLKGGDAQAMSTYRYPGAREEKHSAVDMVALDKPEPGTWRADTVGNVTDWFILQKPPFELSLVAQQPRAKYVENQAVHLAIMARADDKTVLAEVSEHLTISGEVVSGATNEIIDDVELTVGAEEGAEVPDPIVYHDTSKAELTEPEKAEVLTAELLCQLTWSDVEVWTHKKIVSFEVIPATGLFAVQPEELDFGAFWSDSEGGELKISILSNQDDAMFSLASDQEPVSFRPRLLEVMNGEEREVNVHFDPSKVETMGEFEGAATVTLDIGDVTGKKWDESVKLMANVVRLVGDEVVKLPDTTPGFSVSYAIPHALEPEGKIVFELSDLVHTSLGPDEIHPIESGARATGAEAPAQPAIEPAPEVAGDAPDKAPAAEDAVDEDTVDDGAAAEGVAAEGMPEEGAEETASAEGAMDDEGVADDGADEVDESAAGDTDAAVEEMPVQPVVTGPVEKDAVRLTLQLVENEGQYEIRGEVPLDAPGGIYIGTLTVSIPEGSRPPRPSERPSVPAPKKLRVMMGVGDMKPQLAVVRDEDGTDEPVIDIEMVASERGWAGTRIKFVLKHADVAQLSYEMKDLIGPGGASISKRFCIQALPQNDWDGKTVVLGGEHELLYRVFATSDLVQGEYSGEMPIKLMREGEVAVEVTIPIKVDVNLE
jgi:Mg-chelatase subunit ChlD